MFPQRGYVIAEARVITQARVDNMTRAGYETILQSTTREQVYFSTWNIRLGYPNAIPIELKIPTFDVKGEIAE